MVQLTDKHLTTAEHEFANGKIGRLFCKYAIPGVVCLLFVGIQTVIDGFFVGNYIGANALAGINIAMPLYTFVASLIVVVGIGCQATIGISSGEGNYQKANDAIKTAFIFIIGFTSLICGLLLCFKYTIITFLGADEQLYSHSVDYVTALAPFFPLLSILFLGDYFLKSQGKPNLSMIIMGSSVIINIALDYFLIAHLGLGTIGAGLSTGISFTIGALIVLPRMFSRSSPIAVQKGKFRLSLLGRMLYNGSSEGVSELSAGIQTFIFNLTMMHYVGALGVAAFTSISYLIYLGITVFVGMSDGIIPVMSYNYGASNIRRVLSILRRNVIVNGVVGIGLCVLAFFWGENIITLFFDKSIDNQSTIELAVHGSKICAFAFLFNGFNIAMSSFFTAIGDARLSVIISFMRGFVFIGLGIFFYPLMLGVDGVWITIPSAELITLVFAVIILRHRIALKRLVK